MKKYYRIKARALKPYPEYKTTLEEFDMWIHVGHADIPALVNLLDAMSSLNRAAGGLGLEFEVTRDVLVIPEK